MYLLYLVRKLWTVRRLAVAEEKKFLYDEWNVVVDLERSSLFILDGPPVPLDPIMTQRR